MKNYDFWHSGTLEDTRRILNFWERDHYWDDLVMLKIFPSPAHPARARIGPCFVEVTFEMLERTPIFPPVEKILVLSSWHPYSLVDEKILDITWKAKKSEIGLILNQSSVYVCICSDQISAFLNQVSTQNKLEFYYCRSYLWFLEYDFHLRVRILIFIWLLLCWFRDF